MTKLVLTGVLLGLITACGDNGNDVGFFEDEAMGGTGQGDGTTDSASTDAAATSSGTGGSGDTSSSGADGTSDGSSTTTDASSVGGTGASTGTDSSTTAMGVGGTGAAAGEETTSGGSGGQTSTGTGGTSNTGGSSNGGSGGNNETCPAERPVGNTECNAVGVCDYGEGCTQDLMACEEGLWGELEPEPRPTCADFGPGSYPENGQSCECLGDLRCQFTDCEGRGVIRASCSGGTWQVEDAECVARPCAAEPGGEDVLMCQPGEICVAVDGAGPAATYECAANPCADARLQSSCDCAGALCPESDAYRCEVQEEATVVACICDQCN